MNRPLSEFPGVRRRFGSALYDALLTLGVVIALFVVPHMLVGQYFHVTAPGPVLLVHLLIVIAAYYLWHWRNGGQTLAMRTWKIQLVSADGAAPSTVQLLLRFLLAWPSILYVGAGLIWALFDRDRQFLHDRLAGTRIIFKP